LAFWGVYYKIAKYYKKYFAQFVSIYFIVYLQKLLS
jgi:hypothetical protein